MRERREGRCLPASLLRSIDQVEVYRKEIIGKLGELVRIPSVKESPAAGMPFGLPLAAALSWVLGEGARMGFACANVDNYAGHVDFGGGDEIVAVLSHLDVVPVGEGWTYPPFCGEYREGRVYGRGSKYSKKRPPSTFLITLVFLSPCPEVSYKRTMLGIERRVTL